MIGYITLGTGILVEGWATGTYNTFKTLKVEIETQWTIR